MLVACLGMVLAHTTFMIRTKLAKSHISIIRLHSPSSVRIPSSVNNFRNMLSPLGSPIIRKYTKPFNAFKRRGMYPNVSKFLFDLIFTSHQQSFRYKGTGLPGLNQY